MCFTRKMIEDSLFIKNLADALLRIPAITLSCTFLRMLPFESSSVLLVKLLFVSCFYAASGIVEC